MSCCGSPIRVCGILEFGHSYICISLLFPGDESTDMSSSMARASNRSNITAVFKELLFNSGSLDSCAVLFQERIPLWESATSQNLPLGDLPRRRRREPSILHTFKFNVVGKRIPSSISWHKTYLMLLFQQAHLDISRLWMRVWLVSPVWSAVWWVDTRNGSRQNNRSLGRKNLGQCCLFCYRYRLNLGGKQISLFWPHSFPNTKGLLALKSAMQIRFGDEHNSYSQQWPYQ